MLIGAMKELTVGDPTQLATDVGPVIDEKALKSLTVSGMLGQWQI